MWLSHGLHIFACVARVRIFFPVSSFGQGKMKTNLHIVRIISYCYTKYIYIHICTHRPPSASVSLIISYLPICVRQVETNISQKKQFVNGGKNKIWKKVICDRFLRETRFCLDHIDVYSSAIHTGTLFKCPLNHSQSFTIKLTFDAILYILKVAHDIRFLPVCVLSLHRFHDA